MRLIIKIKGLGFILWHAKHYAFHLALGLLWAWFLREQWNELNLKWILLALFGSILPDIEHLFYFFSYGKKDHYTQDIKDFFHSREWRNLVYYIEKGHKKNTNLVYHSLYFVIVLILVTAVCFAFDYRGWTVFIGAFVSHYIFDFIDDIIILGRPNPNWTRWGREKIYH